MKSRKQDTQGVSLQCAPSEVVYQKAGTGGPGDRDSSNGLGRVSTKLRENFPERHLKSNQRNRLKTQKGQRVSGACDGEKYNEMPPPLSHS